jgi:hypothetical protein
MVLSSEGGGPRPLYGGLCAIGGNGEGYFFPTWMAAYSSYRSLSLGEITIAHQMLTLVWAVCILVMQRPGVILKLLSNKALFIERKIPYGNLIDQLTWFITH